MQLSDDNINLNREFKFVVNNDVRPNVLAALIKYIKKITATYPAPYTLMCSGGADSQALLWAWELSGEEYNAVHITYDDYNKFDTDTLDEFTKRYGIPYKKINFDVINFLETDYESYARKYQCGSPHMGTYMAMSELIPEGTKIFSGNLVYNSGNLPLNNTIYGLQRYANTSGNSVIPFFLLHDDDVTSAAVKLYNDILDRGALEFVTDPYLIGQHDVYNESLQENLSNMRILGGSRDRHYQEKILLYRTIGIPIISQHVNYTGFDEIKDYYDQFTDRITTMDKIKYGRHRSQRIFDHLFRHKYIREFKNHFLSVVDIVINT